MKHFILLASLLFAFASAQIVDVTQVQADKVTHVFSDGKNTVLGHVNAMLTEGGNCCGRDDLFMRIVTDEKGYVVEIRVMQGKNECIKKTVEDLVRYIQWTGGEAGKPFFIPIKINVECVGDESGQYAQVMAPAGWQGPGGTSLAGGDQPGGNEPGGNEPGGNEPGGNEPGGNEPGGNEPGGNEPGGNEPGGNEPGGNEPGGNEPGGNEPGGNEPGGNEPGGNEPGGNEPGGNEPGGNEPGGNLASGDLPEGQVENGFFKAPPVKLPPPPRYNNEQGDLSPNESHKSTFANTSGRGTTPTYRGGKSSLAVYLRQELRKNGVCDTAHVFAELTINSEGKVTDYRIFNANTNPVYQALPKIFAGLEFNPTGVQVDKYYYLEFKTDIQCKERDAIDLRDIRPYLRTPETLRGVRDVDTSNVEKEEDE